VKGYRVAVGFIICCCNAASHWLLFSFSLSQFPWCIGQCRSFGSISDAWWELWYGDRHITFLKLWNFCSHHASETIHWHQSLWELW